MKGGAKNPKPAGARVEHKLPLYIRLRSSMPENARAHARAEGAKKDHQEGSDDPPCPSARFLVQVRAPGARAGPGGAVDDDDVFKRRIVSVRCAANPYLVERRTGGLFSGLFGGPKASRTAGKPREVSSALADVHAAQARIAGIQQELLAEEAQLSAPAGAGGAPRAENMHAGDDPSFLSKEARALRAREAKKAQALAAEQARVRRQNGVKERKLAHETAQRQAAETARQQSRGARALGLQLRHDRAHSAARSSRSSRSAAASAPRRAARSASAPRSRGARGRR